MLLYEVTAHAQAPVADAYRDWLERHAAEMLAFDGFRRADLFETEAPAGTVAFVAHYHVESQAALDRYLAHDAPRMRADGTRRFGDAVQATRRVLHLHRSLGV